MWCALITCCARVQRIDFAGSVSLIGRSTVRRSVGFRGCVSVRGVFGLGALVVGCVFKSFVARIVCGWLGFDDAVARVSVRRCLYCMVV